jgi:hypothetical protein
MPLSLSRLLSKDRTRSRIKQKKQTKKEQNKNKRKNFLCDSERDSKIEFIGVL